MSYNFAMVKSSDEFENGCVLNQNAAVFELLKHVHAVLLILASRISAVVYLLRNVFQIKVANANCYLECRISRD